MKRLSPGIVYLILASVIYSIMPVLIRVLNAGNIPPVSQVFLRYIFAFLAAVLYFRHTRSFISIKKETLLFFLAVSLLGYSGTNLLFTYSMIHTEISRALFIFYCFTIITPLLGFVFLKERLNKYNTVALVVSFLGLIFLFKPTVGGNWQIGTLFALGAAFLQSFYLVGRKILTNYNSETLLLGNTAVGVVSIGILALTLEKNFYFGQSGIRTMSGETWLLTILFGLLNFSGWFLMTRGFQLVKTSTGSLVMLSENIFAVMFALIFFQEVPLAGTIWGGVLILIAILLVLSKEASKMLS